MPKQATAQTNLELAKAALEHSRQDIEDAEDLEGESFADYIADYTKFLDSSDRALAAAQAHALVSLATSMETIANQLTVITNLLNGITSATTDYFDRPINVLNVKDFGMT